MDGSSQQTSDDDDHNDDQLLAHISTKITFLISALLRYLAITTCLEHYKHSNTFYLVLTIFRCAVSCYFTRLLVGLEAYRPA